MDARACVALLLLGLIAGVVAWDQHRAPSVSIGGTLNPPLSISLDPITRKVFVLDGVSAIYRYTHSPNLIDSSLPEQVWHGTRRCRRDGLKDPKAIFVDRNANMWVADTGNKRILRFPDASNALNGTLPDLVLGQRSFTTCNLAFSPTALFVDKDDILWVAQQGSLSLLVYYQASQLTNDSQPDLQLGVAPGDLITSIWVDKNRHTLWLVNLSQNKVFKYDNLATLNVSAVPTLIFKVPYSHDTYSVVANKDGSLFFVERGSGFPRVTVYPIDVMPASSNFYNFTYILGDNKMFNRLGGAYFDDADNALWVVDTGANRILRFSNLDVPIPTHTVPTTTTTTTPPPSSAIGGISHAFLVSFLRYVVALFS